MTLTDAAEIVYAGQHLVAGRPWTHDLDATRDQIAREAVRDAPENLGALTDSGLSSLYYRAIRVAAFDERATSRPALLVIGRVMEERKRREAVPAKAEGREP